MTLPPLSSDEPASAVQLGAAMAALGLYDGTNTAAEHTARPVGPLLEPSEPVRQVRARHE
ncbi:hypothetical protein AB0J28_34715 [Streptosporangium canum]|uniref:hypothetical protein n=1 Tax=Streptosporangium canum TaxID=324952 RepID=UPI00341F0760